MRKERNRVHFNLSHFALIERTGESPRVGSVVVKDLGLLPTWRLATSSGARGTLANVPDYRDFVRETKRSAEYCR